MAPEPWQGHGGAEGQREESGGDREGGRETERVENETGTEKGERKR
jgi:hypothetical protein